MSDVGQLLERGRDLATRDAAQLGEVGTSVPSHETQRQHRRLPRIEVSDQDLVDLRVVGDAVDRLLHLDEGQIHVRLPVEAQRREQPTRARDLADLADAAHRKQTLLDLLTVEPLHLTRRTVPRAHRDHDRRRADVGQQVEGQLVPGQPSHQRHRQRQDGDGHRPDCGESSEVLHSVSRKLERACRR